MSYEILLSDTARTGLDQRPVNDVLLALFDRIARVPDLDHVLSAAESTFELRYQNINNTYAFFRRDDGAQQVTIAYFCEMSVPPSGLPDMVPKLRVVDKQIRDIPNGMEADVTVEITQPDGSVSTRHQFTRKIDLGGHYMTVIHQPGGTMIVTGKKGRVEGDFRHDEIELLHLGPGGTVKRFPPNTVPVWIKNPFEGDGRDVNERIRDYMNSPRFTERMEQARKWLSLG